ncbi:MAG TPA: hypothetical protein VFF07_01055 [Actinomycetota bacterium]|nr:hypothetical protein [Actinomycetota bacterium]
MGILDDAIKEHLELKRQHGAGDSELEQLEDEAFGASERPGDEGSVSDPLAEAPTEFITQPDLEPEAGAEATTEPGAPEAEEESGRPSLRSEIADLQEAPPPEPEQSAPEPEEPAEEESPAMEHEAIAEQPTEMYDIEEELASSQAEAPSEEELVEEGMDEPRLAPVDPLAGIEDADAAAEDEEDNDFWDEKRLSDELDQALEAPREIERETVLDEDAEAEADAPEAEAEKQPPPAGSDEDVLEETPDFLEEAPEDDQLWFEQKPPKDFDFDD